MEVALKEHKTDKGQQTKNVKSRLYILHELSSENLINLSGELFVLSNKIFGNMTREEFDRFIVRSGAMKTYVMVYRNKEGEMVGFFALHVFKLKINGRNKLIFRGQTGLLQEYRRTKVNMYFTFFIIIKYRFLFPFTPIYCFLAVLSPSMYAVLAKCLLLLSPRYDRETPKEELELLKPLRKQFGFENDPDNNLWITPVGVVSLSSEKEKEFWNKTNNPHIRFYLQTNPKFREGNGLVTLIPFSWRNIIVSSWWVLSYIVDKKLGRSI